MKAARFHSKNDIRIETIPKPPSPGPDEVTVDVHWGGICGTDLHEYICGPLAISPPSRPHALTHQHLPLTMGHEFCGRVSRVPEGSGSTLKVGQAVVVDPRLNCQECDACRAGTDNLCSDWGFLGLNGGGGGGAGFSEKVNVQMRMCHVLPDSVDLNDAVLIEPLTVGRHAISASGVSNFSSLTVLVVGGGPVGLSVLYNLRAKGVGRVFVSEPTARRSAMVRDLDLAEEVFNPLVVGVAEECKARTEGRGVDVVFDCAGIAAGLRAGMQALKVRGCYVNVAGWEQPLTLPLEYCMMKEITVKFSMAYDDKDFKEVVAEFVAGKFEGAEKMISARIALDDLTVKGFDELITKKDEHVKIVATPRTELLG